MATPGKLQKPKHINFTLQAVFNYGKELVRPVVLAVVLGLYSNSQAVFQLWKRPVVLAVVLGLHTNSQGSFCILQSTIC